MSKVVKDAGQKMLEQRYLYREEKTYEDLVDRILSILPDNQHERKEILREGMLNYEFVPSTPILTNAGTGNKELNEKPRGMAISCFISEFDDKINHIIETHAHNAHLSSDGGGVGTSMSAIREVGAEIKDKGKTGGLFPFLSIQNSISQNVSQGGLRGGSTVVNLDISHPEIEEFIAMRKVEEGSDKSRKFPRLHHTVHITDDFMNKVLRDEPFDLISPRTKEVVKTVNAFDLFMDLIETRYIKGEPNIVFIDTVRRNKSIVYQKNNISAKQSNLCCEILLDTSPLMTAVCCLGSFNLAKYDSWKDNYELIEAAMYFLDRILQETVEYIESIEDEEKKLSLQRVVRFILMDRSIGLTH